jgi:DNA-directed RNA polymerase specialized sigma24 family protein
LDDDSTELFEEIDRKASLAESTKKPEIKSEPTEYEEARQEVKEEAVEITLDMLRTLSKKEKKAILKRLLRLEKKKSKK